MNDWKLDELVLAGRSSEGEVLDLKPGDLVKWRDDSPTNSRYVNQLGLVVSIDNERWWFKVAVCWPNATHEDGVFNQHPYSALKKT